MKITKLNQLGMNFTQSIKDEFYNLHNDKYFSMHPESFINPFRVQFKDILSDDGNKNLLFSKASIEVAEKIKVNKFQPKFLKVEQDKKLTFLINDRKFYRVNIKDGEIFVMAVNRVETEQKTDYVSYDTFKIKPSENLVIYPQNQNDYINDKNFIDFLKLLIFIEYSKLEEVVMMPNQTYGTKKEGKYFNETDKKFIIVDSAWNKIIVRTEGFGVIGHLRWQVTGKNRGERKLTYVREYVKNGYVRNATKTKLNQK